MERQKKPNRFIIVYVLHNKCAHYIPSSCTSIYQESLIVILAFHTELPTVWTPWIFYAENVTSPTTTPSPLAKNTLLGSLNVTCNTYNWKSHKRVFFFFSLEMFVIIWLYNVVACFHRKVSGFHVISSTNIWTAW